MAFAEPDTCPDCRARLDGATRCPRCRLDLSTTAGQNVLAALRAADGWLLHARAESLRPADADPSALPTAPPVAPTRPTRPRLSAGAVVLALGALCLLVAGTIFVTVSWGSLGVVGRALVLLAVSALVATAATVVTRRGLRGSAESLWAVALGLLTLDWFAARDQGLLGLDDLPPTPWTCAWVVAVVAASLVVVRLGRREPLGVELAVPSLVAGLAPWVGAVALSAEVAEALPSDRAAFWSAATAVAVLAVAVGTAAAARLRLGLAAGATGLGIALVATLGAAVLEAVEHPSARALSLDAHGIPLLLVAAATAALAVVGRLPGPVRTVSAVLAASAAALLLVLPVEDAAPGRGGVVVTATLLLLLAVPTGRGPAVLGLRLAGPVLAAGLSLVALTWTGALAAAVVSASDGGGRQPLARRISLFDAPAPPGWLALVATVGLAGWLLAAVRDETAPGLRSSARAGATAVVLVGALTALALVRPPAVGLSAGVLVAASALFLARPAPRGAWGVVAVLLATAAPVVALDSWWATVIVWPLAAALLAVAAVRHVGPLATAAAAGAAAWGAATAPALAQALEAGPRATSLALAVASAVALLVATRLAGRPAERLGVEAGTTVAGLVAVGLAAGTTSAAWTAVVLTVLGGAALAVALLVADRRLYRWPALVLLGAAWVLRLAASDVEVVEAYTAPFALVLLGVGAWSLRRADGPGSTPALGPGLTLALLPSLPQALDDPTSLRALLLGLAAAAALGWGVARRLSAPLVAGATTLALVVLANVGPYAVAVPRWVLIAATGVVLLGVGVTWEDRVRDGRAAVRRIATMR